MKINFEYTIIGSFNIPSLKYEEAKKNVEKILIEGDINIISQGKKYCKYIIKERN